MLNCGIIGYRGMVGQVLLSRMSHEKDFSDIHTTFFGEGDQGNQAPKIEGPAENEVKGAFELDSLCSQDILICLKGGDYSKEIYPQILEKGFKGIWIDASSAFRMDDDALIILDPLNSDAIQKALESGIKKFCGGNCTVSLLLLALQGLIEKGEIEWVNSMSYQAASGAGAEGINGLIKETQDLMSEFNLVDSALDNERHLSEKLLLKEELTFDAPLAFSLIPFIDEPLFDGETREEWKAGSESARILGEKSFPVDGLCVRVPTLRAHAQALLIKTKSELQASEVEEILSQGNEWLHVIPNTAEESRSFLNPIAVSGKLDINIGRIKKVKHDSHLITAFTVGDQLVWGAAEPLRRMLNIAKKHLL